MLQAALPDISSTMNINRKISFSHLMQIVASSEMIVRKAAVRQRHQYLTPRIVSSTIDYRATYVYGTGNGRAPPIVLHWATLKHSPEYLVLAKIN